MTFRDVAGRRRRRDKMRPCIPAVNERFYLHVAPKIHRISLVPRKCHGRPPQEAFRTFVPHLIECTKVSYPADFAIFSCNDLGRMSFHTCSMWSRHSRLVPVFPESRQPEGSALSAGQI